MSAPSPANLREALADLYAALVELAAVLAAPALVLGLFALWAGACALFLGWHAVWFAPISAALLACFYKLADLVFMPQPGERALTSRRARDAEPRA